MSLKTDNVTELQLEIKELKKQARRLDAMEDTVKQHKKVLSYQSKRIKEYKAIGQDIRTAATTQDSKLMVKSLEKLNDLNFRASVLSDSIR